MEVSRAPELSRVGGEATYRTEPLESAATKTAKPSRSGRWPTTSTALLSASTGNASISVARPNVLPLNCGLRFGHAETNGRAYGY